MLMKKLSEEHYIVVDNSEIKEGDWIGFPNLKKFVPVQYFGGDLTGGEKKITHSTKPLDCACSNRGSRVSWTWADCAERNHCFDKIQYLPLQEVKELLGVVDKAFKRYPIIENDKDHNDRNYYRRSAYYKALEDNKEKKYTEEDMVEAYKMGLMRLSDQRLKDYMLPKTEWEVEFVDGKLKLKP